MNTIKKIHTVSKEKLISAIRNTYDETIFLIGILLGNMHKKMSLKEHTEFVWKPVGTVMECQTSKYLETILLDEFWAGSAINVLRFVLGIKDVV